jgi:hypothetical protein
MASRSLPIPTRQAQKQVQTRTWAHAPSLRAAIIAFVAVLILFRWLHLILALQIASTGRQIQLENVELQRLERANSELQRRIAAAESPGLLADEAIQLGYAPRSPLYVRVAELIGSPQNGAGRGAPGWDGGRPGVSVLGEAPAGLNGAFSTWLEVTPAP